jgi:phospholipid/cholesterol/gamma-HCH transport system ATP-binding protein
MNVIEFKNVEKSFDGTLVLDGVSFSVRKGEIFAVVGPSGTGKSVTLKHIVGLILPDAGEVEVSTKRIGYLFQSGALLAWMTVAENVALPLVETPHFQRMRSIKKFLPRLKLSDFWMRRTSTRPKFPAVCKSAPV